MIATAQEQQDVDTNPASVGAAEMRPVETQCQKKNTTQQPKHTTSIYPLESPHPISSRPMPSMKPDLGIDLDRFDDPLNRHNFLVPYSDIPIVPNRIDEITNDSMNKIPSMFGDTTSPVEVL